MNLKYFYLIRHSLEQEDMDNLGRQSLFGAWYVQCRNGRAALDLPALKKHRQETL